MRDANKLADDYLALWNETEPVRRKALLTETWTPDATYADPLISGAGLMQIDDLIGAVQSKFPGFRFKLVKCAESMGDHVRFSWELGPPGGEAPIGGTDFVVRDGDRIKSVVGFLDRVPTGA